MRAARALPLLAAAAALTLTACGGGHHQPHHAAASSPASASAKPASNASLAPDDSTALARQAVKRLRKVHSVHVHGTIPDDSGTGRVDISFGSGGVSNGTFAFGADGTVSIISQGSFGWCYLKADTKFYKTQMGKDYRSAVGRLLAGRWAARKCAADSAKLFNLSDLASDMSDYDMSMARSGGTVVMDGVKTMKIVDIEDGGMPVTMWLRARSPHDLVRVDDTSGEGDGDLHFSRYGMPVDTTAPPADETVTVPNSKGAAQA